ncbi:MAG: hypothetical protein NC489_42615, partial [Ruminococcus flavefaciens]|nr:hypothetical protein [Ruminococcus flavefaciens]
TGAHSYVFCGLAFTIVSLITSMVFLKLFRKYAKQPRGIKHLGTVYGYEEFQADTARMVVANLLVKVDKDIVKIEINPSLKTGFSIGMPIEVIKRKKTWYIDDLYTRKEML